MLTLHIQLQANDTLETSNLLRSLQTQTLQCPDLVLYVQEEKHDRSIPEEGLRVQLTKGTRPF